MLTKADNTETLVNYCHGDGCSLSQERLYEFVAMHGEHQHAIAIQTHEVVVLWTCCAVHLDLVRVLYEELGQVDVDHEDIVIAMSLRYY